MNLGLTLTLLTALGWALFDVARKRLALAVSPVALTVWLPLGQVPLLAFWALWAGPGALPTASVAPMLASMALNVLGLLGFMQAVRWSPLSLTIPLLSFTPVATSLLAWVFRGQVPTLAQIGGAALVVAGAVALGLGSGLGQGLGAFLKDRGVRRMAGAALAWSLTAVLDQVALERGAGALYAPALSLGVGVMLGAVMLVRGQGGLLKETFVQLRRLPLLAPATFALGAVALAVQLEALRHAPVGFIETIKRGTGMAAAILFGRLVFHEPVNPAKLAAVALMTTGVGLVVLG